MKYSKESLAICRKDFYTWSMQWITKSQPKQRTSLAETLHGYPLQAGLVLFYERVEK